MPEEVLEQTDEEVLGSEEVEETPEETPEETTEEEPEETTEDKPSEELKDFPYERASIQEIKAKYPDFFKDFPTFRDSIFREIEYTKIFPTVEDAKEAVEDSLVLDGLRESVLAGKSEDIFDAISQTDIKAAEKFALTFLPTLFQKNNQLYTRTISPVFEVLARKLGASNDENERNAAIVVARYLWGRDGDSIVSGEKTFIRNLEDSEEEKRLKEREQNIHNEQYNNFRSSVLEDLVSQRTALILRGLDPNKSMTASQKEMLVERIANLVDKNLASDESHMKVMNARWSRAKKEGLNNASKEKIISAYLSRAKQVIPSIRDKERDAFFGTQRKASQRRTEEIDGVSSSRKEVTSGRIPGSDGRTVLKPSRDLYRKMSDMDILNS